MAITLNLSQMKKLLKLPMSLSRIQVSEQKNCKIYNLTNNKFFAAVLKEVLMGVKTLFFQIL